MVRLVAELVSSNSANTENCLLIHSQWRNSVSGSPTSLLYKVICWRNHVTASVTLPLCNNKVDILKCNCSAIVLISSNRWIDEALDGIPEICTQNKKCLMVETDNEVTCSCAVHGQLCIRQQESFKEVQMHSIKYYLCCNFDGSLLNVAIMDWYVIYL